MWPSRTGRGHKMKSSLTEILRAGLAGAALAAALAVTPAMPGRDAVLTAQAWNELLRINQWVNDTVKPMTDLEHWGVAERWNYPDDGYGDCEDDVLLKRKMLMQAG